MEKYVESIETPCYVCDRGRLAHNLAILDSVQKRTGCTILLALKGFAMHSLFPQISRTLKGVSASSLDEARLGFEEFGGQVHAYAPAYSESEFDELLTYVDHIIFNSFSQWDKFREKTLAAPKGVSAGIRVNPGYSEVKVAIYNPCAPKSRLGVPPEQFRPELLDGISGLHFHALCEQNSDSLEHVLTAFEKHFGSYVPQMQWINFGGGHHITRADYDVERLCRLINDFQQSYGVPVYLEPGEAIALNTGVLVAQVLDIVHNEMDIAILDTSAAALMPDVLEMPYRPEIEGAGLPGVHPYTYRLGGPTCLAGDVVGDYSFQQPLKAGSRLVFKDMAHYTMVKNTTFNGVRLPSIAIYDPASGEVDVVRRFHYEDYRNRLS